MKTRLLILSLCLSACAIGEKLEAVENIDISSCIDECSATSFSEGEGGNSGCLSSVDENSCFNNIEACFDSVHACNDYCILCEEDGSCPIAGECYRNCNTIANSCTDYLDDCAESLVEEARDSLINDCLMPFSACVSDCIEEAEDSLK